MTFMSRKFTLKEKLLLLVLALILLGGFYYFIIFRPIQEEIATCKAVQLETEDKTQVEQVRASQKKKMLEQLENSSSELRGEICVYNNIKNEMDELSEIMLAATNYNLSFSQASASGSTVRRDISVSFQTTSFAQAVEILQRMRDSQYRCIVKNISLSGGGQNSETGIMGGLRSAEAVSVSATITFYETMLGAEDLSGLSIPKNQSKDTSEQGNSSLSDLAN